MAGVLCGNVEIHPRNCFLKLPSLPGAMELCSLQIWGKYSSLGSTAPPLPGSPNSHLFMWHTLGPIPFPSSPSEQPPSLRAAHTNGSSCAAHFHWQTHQTVLGRVLIAGSERQRRPNHFHAPHKHLGRSDYYPPLSETERLRRRGKGICQSLTSRAGRASLIPLSCPGHHGVMHSPVSSACSRGSHVGPERLQER